jgi:hypothetical protein
MIRRHCPELFSSSMVYAESSRPAFAFVLLGVVCAAAGCASDPKPSARDAADAADTGRVLPARNPSEQTILQHAGTLPAGVPRSLGGATVVAGAAYNSAASGRICRTLRIGPATQSAKPLQSSQRLACTDGQAWFFVPDVLGLDPASR